MADDEITHIRDCVNPAILVEREDGQVTTVHIASEFTTIERAPLAVFIGDTRYVPAELA
jgi:hypothetical protein